MKPKPPVVSAWLAFPGRSLACFSLMLATVAAAPKAEPQESGEALLKRAYDLVETARYTFREDITRINDKGHQTRNRRWVKKADGVRLTRMETDVMTKEGVVFSSSILLFNDSGTWRLDPQTKAAIKLPGDMNAESEDARAERLRRTERGLVRPEVKRVRLGEPAEEFYEVIKDYPAPPPPSTAARVKDWVASLSGKAAETGGQLGRMHYYISPATGLARGYSAYTVSGVLKQSTIYREMRLGEEVADDFFAIPAGYKLYFPADLTDFKQRLVSSETSTKQPTKAKNENAKP